jgi:RNA polymerase sigma factor (sigma-70 family)
LNHQLTGALEPGEIVPAEVVDEAILRIYQRLSEGKTQVDLEHELIREIIAVAKAFAKEVQTTRSREVSIDVPAEAIPDPEKVSTLGEEILYFYQPDEVVKLEDVIADPNAFTPEQVVESEELQKLLYTFLSELPADERNAFTLVAIEGFIPEEASMVMQKSAEAINQLVRQAEEELRNKLSQAEKTMAEERLRKIYGSLRSLRFEISLEERMAAAQKLIG